MRRCSSGAVHACLSARRACPCGSAAVQLCGCVAWLHSSRQCGCCIEPVRVPCASPFSTVVVSARSCSDEIQCLNERRGTNVLGENEDSCVLHCP